MLDHAATMRLTAAAANVAELRMRLLHRTAADATGQARIDGALSYGRAMVKAARMLAALKRDGWMETRRSGSHRVLVKGDQRIWAYRDGVDLGGPAMARIARDYGYTVDELRKLGWHHELAAH